MKAEIITIGDEILIGQILDSNSAWMCEQLNLLGIEVYQTVSIHDNWQQIQQALADAEKQADLVLITGGLGPTKDDITKNTLCDFFGCNLIVNNEVLQHVSTLLGNRGIEMNQLNKNQALVPEKCTVLANVDGTAPGMWFEKENTIFISMPGVPFEMKGIMIQQVLPRLKERGQTEAIFHKTVLLYGIPESELAEKIESWELALPPFIKLAYLPSPSAMKLRLSAYGSDQEALKREIECQILSLSKLVSEYIFGYDDDNLPSTTGALLERAGATVSIAESCTGGYISHLFTSNSGSSAYFKGSVVSYANDAKKNILGVEENSLNTFGAVSREVAMEMVQGVKRIMQTDYAIATTGIAGPDGGSETKPVGTVWIAVAGKQNLWVEKYNFAQNRERNIIRSAYTAINLLRQMIQLEIDHLSISAE